MSDTAPITATTANSPSEVPEVARKKSLSVAIAALNEEKYIEETVRTVLAVGAKMPEVDLEIIVVDDGSVDRTSEIVRGLAKQYDIVRLIQNPKNLGLGASTQRAIEAASKEKFILIPGDNDIPSSALELFFLNAYAADIVMTYFHNDECRGRGRYLLSALFKLIYTTVFDLYVKYINGPAVYPTEKLKQLRLHSTRFSIVVEINVKLLRQGVTFMELPSYRQVGMEGSTSAGWRSLLETARVFIQLLVDVYIREPSRYSHRPVRLRHTMSTRAGDAASQNDPPALT